MRVTGIVVESPVTYWICDCLNCGSKGNKIRAGAVAIGTNRSCGCLVSVQENFIAYILDKYKNKYNLNYKRQVSFSNLLGVGGRNLKFDFLVELNNQKFLIEYDGIQHREPVKFNQKMTDEEAEKEFKELQIHDKLKTEYCRNNNITLYRLQGLVTDEVVLDILNKYI